MLVSQVQRVEIIDKISVTEEEAQAYYDAHRQEFTTPAEMTLREILIEVPANDRASTSPQDDAAGQGGGHPEATAGGEPFPRLAGEFSAARVESQRRPDRPAEAARNWRRPCRDLSKDAGRRYHRADAHAARLSDPETRSADRNEDHDRSKRRAADIGNRIGEQKMRGELRSTSIACETSDDHLAQRRVEEGVRTRRLPNGGQASASRPRPSAETAK